VPPAVALLNYISSGILWRIFAKMGHFARFPLYIINNAVRISEAAMVGAGGHDIKKNKKKIRTLIYIHTIIYLHTNYLYI
jgi:hypothetical protein